MRLLSYPFLVCMLLLTIPVAVYGQVGEPIEEPELRGFDPPRTLVDEGLRHGLSFNLVINNFGFGIGGEYKRVLSPFMEGTLNFRATGLRDVSEQTFTDIFFGQQIIPNKFKRAFAFPLMAGVRQRLLATQIEDNYRFYVEGALGPVAAFSYPYFDDRNGNGFRENFPQLGIVEPVNDVFTGLGDGEWHLGLSGEIKLSLDIGQNFASLSSIQFGYTFHYFDEGIQIMQPNQPVRNPDARPGDFPFLIEDGQLVMQEFFEPQRFFGTPQISFVFGRLW